MEGDTRLKRKNYDYTDPDAQKEKEEKRERRNAEIVRKRESQDQGEETMRGFDKRVEGEIKRLEIEWADMVKTGRPRRAVSQRDWQIITDLARIQCTVQEITSVMRIQTPTLNRECQEAFGQDFKDFIAPYESSGKCSLRRLQWKKARTGDSIMLRWLGKNWLDQTDNLNHSTDPNKPFQIEFVSMLPGLKNTSRLNLDNSKATTFEPITEDSDT